MVYLAKGYFLNGTVHMKLRTACNFVLFLYTQRSPDLPLFPGVKDLKTLFGVQKYKFFCLISAFLHA